MAKTRLGQTALGFSAVAFLFIFIAFVTSSWLVTDGKLEDILVTLATTVFQKAIIVTYCDYITLIVSGLWIVCFKNFEDIRRWHDNNKFSGCCWVYQEEYYILHDFLLPGFYIAVQFFFTICFVLSLVASFLTLAHLCTIIREKNFICLLSMLGGAMCVAGVTGAIACILFGTYGDSRFWMPHWEHNNLGYSFWFASIGTVSSIVGGLCFLVESRKHNIKRNFFTITNK